MTDFSVSIGKSAKYMYKWFSKDEWETYLQTYCGADVSSIWQAVDIMCSLFIEVAAFVAEELHFKFNNMEAKNSMYFLKIVKELPKDAKEVM